MIDDVLGIPDQLRDALWRVESARLRRPRPPACWSAGWAARRSAATSPPPRSATALTRPMLTVRGYALPSWATSEWTVLCSSYSGETEETLACFEAAEALGARRVVASTGGSLVDQARAAGVPVVGLPGIFQPRAAVAYIFVVAAEVAALCGAAPRIHTEIDAAAAFLAEQLDVAAPAGGRDRRPPRGQRPGRLRGGPHRARRPALEDPGQREREAALLLVGAAGGRPQRDLRLERARGRRRPRRRPARGPRPAPARTAPLRADRRR